MFGVILFKLIQGLDASNNNMFLTQLHKQNTKKIEQKRRCTQINFGP